MPTVSFWDRIRSALEPKTTLSEDLEHQLRLATGALLLEMCRADFKVTADERQFIAESIREGFNLSADETRQLVQDAETESEHAVSLQIYTSLINEYATHQQKVRLIEDLWRVAYADGELHALEENLVTRVAALVEISPRLVRQIRLDIESEQGQGTEQPA